MNDKLIELININKIYNQNKVNANHALININLTFPTTGLFFIIGKSGCGKTTLLNIIGGTDFQTTGDLYFGNNLINKNNICDYRALYIGHIYQNFNLIDNLTVKENLSLTYNIINKSYNQNEVENILSKLEINSYLNTKVKDLSGGEKQRVSIARALIKDAKVILADEPTGSLDTKTAKDIFAILKDLAKDRLVIVISHDIDNANLYADKILTMVDGQINDNITTKNSINILINHNKGLKFKNTIKLAFSNLSLKITKLIALIIMSSIVLATISICLSVYTFNPAKLFADEFSKTTNHIRVMCDDESVISYLEDTYKIPFTRRINSNYLTIENSYLNANYNEPVYLNLLSSKYSYNLNLVGSMPTKTGDILLTNEMYQNFKMFGYHYKDLSINSSDINYDDLIGLKIPVKISRFIPEIYAELTISGIILEDIPDIYYPSITLDTLNELTKLDNNQISIDFATCKMLNEDDIANLYNYINDLNSNFYINSSLNNLINYEIKPVISFFSSILLPIAIIAIVFVIYLIYSYLNLCINLRKNEIGILKLLGSNDIKIFKIYYITSLFIAILSSLLACIITSISIYYINDYLLDMYDISSNIINYAFYEFITIIGLSLLSTFIGVFIPFYKNAKISPISYLNKESN